MGIDEYRAAVMACAMARNLLRQHDLKKILADIDHAEAVGPIFDPTLWKEKSGAMAEDKALIKAALSLAGLEMTRG